MSFHFVFQYKFLGFNQRFKLELLFILFFLNGWELVAIWRQDALPPPPPTPPASPLGVFVIVGIVSQSISQQPLETPLFGNLFRNLFGNFFWKLLSESFCKSLPSQFFFLLKDSSNG